MSRELGLSRVVTGGSLADPSRLTRRQMADILGDVPLFAGLSRRHLNRVADLATTRWVTRGSAIVKAGSPGESFFVILNGRAGVRAGGRRVSMQSGDFFGEMSLIDGQPRSATVTAQTDVLVMVLPRSRFLKLLHSEPKVALALMTALSQRVRALQAAASV
ncbi:MAG: Crp/Fnr family transcriptional regulator [Gaiellales bacterium]